ncbi:MAG TPA: Rieske 2Fe-2S domain-containing protein [Solirubrobacteraceae bacterium]
MPDDPRRARKSKYTADRGIPGAFEGESVTRRRFMTVSANAAGAVAASAFLLPALGFALGPLFEKKPERWEDVGAIDDFNANEYVPRIFTETPGIGEAGKTTAYIRKHNPRLDGPVQKPEQYGLYIAISTRCMHLGCPVRYTAAAQRFICPCHGGVYDALGQRVGGPPVRPLDRFYTRIVNGRLQVGPRFSVNSELRRFSPRYPGEDLDGIGQYLYPSRPTQRKLPPQ